jgi:hypothetical protein
MSDIFLTNIDQCIFDCLNTQSLFLQSKIHNQKLKTDTTQGDAFGSAPGYYAKPFQGVLFFLITTQGDAFGSAPGYYAKPFQGVLFFYLPDI